MQSGQQQLTQPIDSLTPFLGGRWCIKARVTDKSDIRTWNKPTSQGKLFSFTLVDESASIRATVFNDAVDTFNPLLVTGSIYYLSGGQVKTANRRFSNVNNDYELTFDANSQITIARDAAAASSIPLQRYNFVPIEILKQREVGSIVDVLGVVLDVADVSSITQRSTGKELTKRNIMIADRSASVELTVWNDQALQWNIAVGTVVAFRQLRIGNFDGVNVSSGNSSSFDINPNIPDVKKLSDWYISTSGTDVPSISRLGLGAGSAGTAGGDSYLGRRTFSELINDGIGRGEKAEFVDVRCCPVYLKQDSQWYDACPTCNKKVAQEGAQGDRYRCEKCDKQVVPVQRYLVSIQASDNVSQMWLTLFNEAGTEFFGMSASELKKQLEVDPMIVTKLAQARMHRPVLMRLRVKEERGMTGASEDDRVRVTVMRIAEFMPLDDVSEERRSALATAMAAECQHMMEQIEIYG